MLADVRSWAIGYWFLPFTGESMKKGICTCAHDSVVINSNFYVTSFLLSSLLRPFVAHLLEQ